MAEAALDASRLHHQVILEQAFGVPSNPAFTILGLGKLGGQELNLSSDIDIICVFAEDGKTSESTRQRSLAITSSSNSTIDKITR